jgi:cytochrome c oxidase cbb3-type subunit 3
MRLMTGILLSGLAGMVNGAPEGRELYATHCAVCHGANGNGGVGIPLALGSFQQSVDDEFLRRSIRLGRPGRVMPAFQKLSEAQLDAIVMFIRGWSEQTPPVFSDAPLTGIPLHGKQLFASHCASCHGEHGEGGKGTGVAFSRPRDLPIVPPALNNPGFLGSASDAMIKYTLMHGRQGTPMQSFLEQGLTEKDINDVVAYIRTFGKTDAEAGHTKAVEREVVITADSPYSLEETIENVKQSIISQNFQLIRTDYLEHGLVEEGKENKQQVILHFCNFRFLYEALAIDPRVGMFLPCRVTVVEHNGKVQLMTINPLYLSHVFNNDDLDEACRHMYTVYQSILEDATL